MLLIKNRNFLYELRAYLIIICKGGRKKFLIGAESLSYVWKGGRNTEYIHLFVYFSLRIELIAVNGFKSYNNNAKHRNRF